MFKRFSLLLYIIFIMVSFVHADQGGNDNFGYMWTDSQGATSVNYDWIYAKDGTRLFTSLSPAQYSAAGISLPFAFTFYGVTHNTIYISTNGWVSFSDPGGAYTANSTIPTTGAPDSLIAVFWDDMTSLTGGGGAPGVYYKTSGSAPNRKFVVAWDGYYFAAPNQEANFELILYESSNLIKFQYNYINNGATIWPNPVIGIEADGTQGIQYPAGSITNSSAILFHNKNISSGVDASITPASVPAGHFQTFKYTFSNIDPSGTVGLGKVDRFAIGNPLTNPLTVTNIKINEADAFIQNSSVKPTQSGYATWTYNVDSLIIQTSYFEVIDSLVVSFTQTIDNSVSSANTYGSSFDAVLDSSSIQLTSDGGIEVDIVGAAVAYYEFTPSANQATTAGTGIAYTLTARDEFDNAVVNSDDVTLSTPGSSTATFNTGTSINFSGSSTVNFTATDNTAGTFAIRAVNDSDPTVNGESGVITVNPDVEDHFVIVSSTAPITVGNERLLQVRLEDQYNNIIPSASVTFSTVLGSGYFGTPGNTTSAQTTGSNGVAEALYTASSSTVSVNDQIEVTINAVTSTITLPLQAGAVAYYEFTPSADQNTTAGSGIAYTLTARDEFDNAVVNSDDVTLSTPGSSTATFNTGTAVSFSASSTLNFTVTDNTTGNFTVRAVNDADPAVNGESGLITVAPASIDYVLIRSEAGNGGTEVGNLNLTTDDTYVFYAAGYDQFGNYISDVNVDWSTNPDLENITLSNSNKFTFNPSLANVTGTILADHATATDDVTGNITISTGALAQLRIQTSDIADGAILTDTTIAASEDLTLYAVGYDVDGNYLGLASTPSNWILSGLTGTLAPANPTNTVTFSPQASGTGSIRATADSDPTIYDISGTIRITPATIDYVVIQNEPNAAGSPINNVTLNLGETLTLYAVGYDAEDNFVGTANVDWSVTGTLSGLSSNNTNTYVTTLTPTSPGSGTVQTSNANGWTDDATGTVTVQPGTLSRLEIRTAAGGAGVALQDSAAQAGDSWTLYAAGYDIYNNYLGDFPVTWSITGNPIGNFQNAASTAVNTIDFTTVNYSSIRILESGITEYSGVFLVTPGSPDSIAYASSQNFTGPAGSTISDSLAIKVFDAYGNIVPGTTVNWNITDITGSLTPSSSQIGTLGIARTKWKLKNTTGMDSV
ncbi:MAG: hypothetical protein P8X42_01375, partial [Calditrichaceae bacterium]